MNIHKIYVDIPDKLKRSDFIKQISFISKTIVGYSFESNKLSISYRDLIGEEELRGRIADTMNRFVTSDSEEKEIMYESGSKDRTFYDEADILCSGEVISFDNGIIAFSGNAARLFDYFDCIFKKFALELSAEEEKYPVLLPRDTLRNTGYLRTSPQYSMMVGDVDEDMECLERISKANNVEETMEISKFVLSPSACFHVYERYRNAVLEKNIAITLLQNVFRNEGRFSWREYGRLRDYHVREVVFIGNDDYVSSSLNSMIDKTSRLMQELQLVGGIESACDPFVIPQMQRFKLIQLSNKAKYEVRLNCSEDEKLSSASFNRHGNAFTKPFNISIEDISDTVTGCVGYGIERWVLAFLRQYGTKAEEWPICVRKFMKEYIE